jgi:peroxiredoxin
MLPSVDLHNGFPPKKYNLAAYAKNKSILLLGLPGAFTPTWSTKQIPNYLEHQDALRKAGIDSVIVYCVNDGAVMQAWAKDQKVGLVSLLYCTVLYTISYNCITWIA